jgi:hypothetical protein
VNLDVGEAKWLTGPIGDANLESSGLTSRGHATAVRSRREKKKQQRCDHVCSGPPRGPCEPCAKRARVSRFVTTCAGNDRFESHLDRRRDRSAPVGGRDVRDARRSPSFGSQLPGPGAVPPVSSLREPAHDRSRSAYSNGLPSRRRRTSAARPAGSGAAVSTMGGLSRPPRARQNQPFMTGIFISRRISRVGPHVVECSPSPRWYLEAQRREQSRRNSRRSGRHRRRESARVLQLPRGGK